MHLKTLISTNPLFFAFLFPALMDMSLTLIGQDKSYWQTKIVNEASPAYYFLRLSPYLFIIGSLFWFLIWYFTFQKLKTNVKIFFSILFIAGHSWGSSSWLWKIARDQSFYDLSNQFSVILVWFIIIAYLSLIALLATYCFCVFFHKHFSSI